ncbi:dipeptidase PepE [Gallaecimonas sp. GXIMD4217]|uniref:dipeptidase PepE n=1 Tax=Gallaecimonas sp. GXIMD4217 TaxID=3131927 RepID=UPI00311B436B
MRCLLLSASREGDSPYLAHALPFIDRFVHADERELLFVPYAGVTIGWDQYTDKVREALAPLGFTVRGIHEFDDARAAVANAKCIAVGGGNTFRLLSELYAQGLVEAIPAALAKGTPYLGWSAGSNVAGKSIRTTNDMPITEPPSFTAMGLLPFQLNPHYTDYQPPGHNGETRAERLAEFLALNPDEFVFALPEGTALERQGDSLVLRGEKGGLLLRAGQDIERFEQDADLSALLK